MKYVIMVICLFIGFIAGRQTVSIKEKEATRYVEGKTIRDTITNWKSDTVYKLGEVCYKYQYRTDTVYKDVPVVDRDETIKATIEDWNLKREYNRMLFNNENGKLSISLAVQYNELQKLSYSFTPIQKQTVVRKERVFEPFVAASILGFDSFSVGGGFFYHNLGFRAEWASGNLNFGVMYRF